MTQRPFRFGINLYSPETRTEWIEKCRRADELGYDVIGVVDHLGMPPPFPPLVLAAEVTERSRLTTYVSNAAFYNPTVLAREVAGTDQLVEGRLELGLGAGYAKVEFEAAGMPFPTPGERVSHLERTVAELRGLFGSAEHRPRPFRDGGPPLLIAGRGDRVLRLAAREADIIGLSGFRGATTMPPPLGTVDELAEQVELVRTELGEREAELNLLLSKVIVTNDRRAGLEQVATEEPQLTVEELAELPQVLVGTPEQLAEQVLAARERFGFSYFTVHEPVLTDFAPVIEALS